jgi:GTPase SAR1 family protein
MNPQGRVQVKIVILGDSCVGKTSLVSLLTNNSLPSSSYPTVGCSFSAIGHFSQELQKEIDATDITNTPNISVQLWDTAGQERYNSIVNLYFNGTDICFFVFDYNNLDSLWNLFRLWLPAFLESKFINREDWIKRDGDATNYIYFIGNKEDLLNLPENSRENFENVFEEHKKEILDKYNIRCTSISCYLGSGVGELSKELITLAEKIALHKYRESLITITPEGDMITLSSENERAANCRKKTKSAFLNWCALL